MTTDPWRKPPTRAYKQRDGAVTSSVMAAVRSKNNQAETALRKELWHRGFRYRLYDSGLPGRPDIVFKGPRLVVFVDGDFWHGRALVEQGEAALRLAIRTERSDWWVAKLRRTLERDRMVTERLQNEGWRVVRIWESTVKRDVKAVADSIERLLRTHSSVDPEDQQLDQSDTDRASPSP